MKNSASTTDANHFDYAAADAEFHAELDALEVQRAKIRIKRAFKQRVVSLLRAYAILYVAATVLVQFAFGALNGLGVIAWHPVLTWFPLIALSALYLVVSLGMLAIATIFFTKSAVRAVFAAAKTVAGL